MCERLYIAAMLVTHLWRHTVCNQCLNVVLCCTCCACNQCLNMVLCCRWGWRDNLRSTDAPIQWRRWLPAWLAVHQRFSKLHVCCPRTHQDSREQNDPCPIHWWSESAGSGVSQLPTRQCNCTQVPTTPFSDW